MKKSLLVAVCLILSSCTSKTEYGKCVGLNGKENPGLRYEYSAWNIGLGILFFTLILPPVFVVLDELKCPVEKIEL